MDCTTYTDELLSVNALRALSLDQIDTANSGHPGLPLGAAPMAYKLWTGFMNIDPKDPKWPDRDRFVLSAGHGSALLYSLIHMAGFDLKMEDLKNFRQLGSRTPGHPEFGHTEGVEATTGPLGQGVANAVGMAMAEMHLAGLYNKDDMKIVDHYTYALCGDGDLMEGVAQEACSLAGHLKLGKLVLLYDSNDICLDGPLSSTFSENIEGRFTSLGWHYQKVVDGNNLCAIAEAIEKAKAETEKPSIIEVKTVIGFGSQVQGTNKAHGAPLGKEGSEFAKKNLGWNYEPFTVPEEVYENFRKAMENNGIRKNTEWKALFKKYSEKYPEDAENFVNGFNGINRITTLPEYTENDKDAATRKMSEAAIASLAEQLPNFWGGSADLSSSNNTMIKASKAFTKETPCGKNIWYGVREFAMGAIMNGILYHGGTRTFGATFFVFSDYIRPSVRVAALSKLPAIYVFTHDSVAVGEDGPTHEPVEHLSAFRSMPGINVIRPADGNETSAAWKKAVETTDRPTVLALSRQNLPQITDFKKAMEGIEKGAYIIADSEGKLPSGIIIASGSEVSLALEAKKLLKEEGMDVRVVSMPSMEIFEAQSESYRKSVLPDEVTARISVEMGVSLPWYRYLGSKGIPVSIETFGASGKGSKVVESFGFTAENIKDIYLKNFR